MTVSAIITHVPSPPKEIYRQRNDKWPSERERHSEKKWGQNKTAGDRCERERVDTNFQKFAALLKFHFFF